MERLKKLLVKPTYIFSAREDGEVEKLLVKLTYIFSVREDGEVEKLLVKLTYIFSAREDGEVEKLLVKLTYIFSAREDGEVEDTPLPSIIDYPGYTAPPPSDAVDKFRARNMPYSSATPTLSDKRQPKQESKRRKLAHTLGDHVKDDNDMDVDEEGKIFFPGFLFTYVFK